MLLRLFLIGLFMACSLFSTNAQRVIRKGVTEKQPVKKNVVAQYSLNQLQGKWQEVKRVAAGTTEPVNFSDSLLLNFYNGRVEMKETSSMRISMTGDAEIDAPNILSAAGDVYSIHSVNNNKLVLDDGTFTRELQKKDLFYYETAGRMKMEKDSVTEAVNIDINNLKGKWLVYARKAKPGSIKPLTPIIKSIEVSSIAADGIAFGEIVYYTSNICKILPCRMATKDGIIKIITDKDTWSFNTYKADGKEFVFGDTNKLVYYMKQ